MIWTYTGDPELSPKDAVRFLIGDTDPDDPLLSDPEINYLLRQRGGNVELAASFAADGIAAQFSRLADKSVGDLSISLSQKAAAYRELADDLRRRGRWRAVPFAGGISRAQKAAVEADSDRVQPAFSRGMMDHGGIDFDRTDDMGRD